MYYRRALKLQAFLDMASESGKCVIAFSPITFGQAWYMRPLLLFLFFLCWPLLSTEVFTFGGNYGCFSLFLL